MENYFKSNNAIQEFIENYKCVEEKKILRAACLVGIDYLKGITEHGCFPSLEVLKRIVNNKEASKIKEHVPKQEKNLENEISSIKKELSRLSDVVGDLTSNMSFITRKTEISDLNSECERKNYLGKREDCGSNGILKRTKSPILVHNKPTRDKENLSMALNTQLKTTSREKNPEMLRKKSQNILIEANEAIRKSFAVDKKKFYSIKTSVDVNDSLCSNFSCFNPREDLKVVLRKETKTGINLSSENSSNISFTVSNRKENLSGRQPGKINKTIENFP